eukprot:6529-Heterococcus_DN1.PRE.3
MTAAAANLHAVLYYKHSAISSISSRFRVVSSFLCSFLKPTFTFVAAARSFHCVSTHASNTLKKSPVSAAAAAACCCVTSAPSSAVCVLLLVPLLLLCALLAAAARCASRAALSCVVIGKRCDSACANKQQRCNRFSPDRRSTDFHFGALLAKYRERTCDTRLFSRPLRLGLQKSHLQLETLAASKRFPSAPVSHSESGLSCSMATFLPAPVNQYIVHADSGPAPAIAKPKAPVPPYGQRQ